MDVAELLGLKPKVQSQPPSVVPSHYSKGVTNRAQIVSEWNPSFEERWAYKKGTVGPSFAETGLSDIYLSTHTDTPENHATANPIGSSPYDLRNRGVNAKDRKKFEWSNTDLDKILYGDSAK